MSANNIARNVLDKLWTENTAPIDVKKIAERAGIEVRFVNEIDGRTDISGCINYIGSKAIIQINKAEPRVRVRFTLAHELGHYFLNHGKSYRDSTNEMYNRFSDEEMQANAFAAQLLMPKHVVDFFIEEYNITDLYELADTFNVSETAMRYRLINLGWINP